MEIDIETAYWAEKSRGTAPTKLEELEHDGVYWYMDMIDPKKWFVPVPNWRGVKNYFGSEDKYTYEEVEDQVEGSCCRYNHPDYKELHYEIKKKTEAVIGRKLYPTYYYDRFYFPGQELTIHADRPACEISISVHIASNIEGKWPLWIKTPNGERHSIALRPGDGMLYKGCERPHWRDPLPREYTKTWYGKKVEKEGLFYHQIFFHYVLADGLRSHFANDLLKGQL